MGGVCGGIADYLDADPTIVRLLWAIITLVSVGFGLLGFWGWVAGVGLLGFGFLALGVVLWAVGFWLWVVDVGLLGCGPWALGFGFCSLGVCFGRGPGR